MIDSYTVGTYGFGIKSRNIEERAVFFPVHYHLITTTFRVGKVDSGIGVRSTLA
jgi:hypothetical protein